MRKCRVGCLIRSERIVFNALAGTLFHKRYVFVRRGMVHNLRMIGFKNLVDSPGIADGANQNNQFQVGILLLQFQLNAIGIVFINIKDNKFFRTMCRNLSAKLGTDTSTASGHQHGLSINKLKDFL